MAGYTPKSFRPDPAPAATGGGAWRPKSFRAEAPAAPVEQQIGAVRAFGDSMADWGTAGFADELGGGLQALMQGITKAQRGADGQPLRMEDVYRQARGENRRERKLGAEQQPVASALGAGAGILTGAAMLPAAGTVGGAAAIGAGLGAASGLGQSEADLTKGDFGGAGIDSALGAGFGAVTGGIGAKVAQAVTRKMTGLGAKAGQKVAQADAQIDEMAQAKVREQLAQKAGELAGETQKGNRFVENIMRLAPDATPEERAAIEVLEKSGVMPQLRSQLLKSNLADLPKQAQTMGLRRAEMEALQGGSEEAFAAAREAIANPRAQTDPRFKRYAGQWIGKPLGATIGAAVGGAPGAFIGAEAGSLAFGQLRPMQHAIKRMVTHPAVTKRVLGLAQRALSGDGQAAAALGRSAPIITRSFAEGGERAATIVHALLLEKDPEYRAQVEALAE